jgi:hypothetical protein
VAMGRMNVMAVTVTARRAAVIGVGKRPGYRPHPSAHGG